MTNDQVQEKIEALQRDIDSLARTIEGLAKIVDIMVEKLVKNYGR